MKQAQRSGRRPTAAARALSELSQAFAEAWAYRHTIEGRWQHIARDTVSDVVAHGLSPRRALLLNGFALDPSATAAQSAHLSESTTTMNPPAEFGARK
ncbi:xylulokinase [Mycolicibacterium novocastrense]|uniref:Xylulokinase n=1 Tax=Mycolicibacterium novocastrense TaxID=59813 RepID=A0ABQ0KE86_MYCNV|nr:xylulokinase [Mycolicibacterium novocastrense]